MMMIRVSLVAAERPRRMPRTFTRPSWLPRMKSESSPGRTCSSRRATMGFVPRAELDKRMTIAQDPAVRRRGSFGGPAPAGSQMPKSCRNSNERTFRTGSS